MTPSPSLTSNLRSELQRWPPFAQMAAEHVDRFVQAATQAYCEPNEVVLSPDHGAVTHLQLIRRGSVSGRHGLAESGGFQYEAGEMFPVGAALAAFERWLGDAPLIAFHAVFDQTMIERAMWASLGHALPNPWLDLEPVADALHPEVGGRALDDWLRHFGIDCAVRHQAAADTLATAELLLRLWPAARSQACITFAALQQLAAQRRWLVPPSPTASGSG